MLTTNIMMVVDTIHFLIIFEKAELLQKLRFKHQLLQNPWLLGSLPLTKVHLESLIKIDI